jgi:ubiquinol-cytochrome c reductase cytochrome b subunit
MVVLAAITAIHVALAFTRGRGRGVRIIAAIAAALAVVVAFNHVEPPVFATVFIAAAVASAAAVLFSPRDRRPLFVALLVAAVLLAAFRILDAKVWGVILMGVSTLIFFLLPWLDRSPVRSIRYKGPLFRTALTIFVIAFLVLGYYGVQPVTAAGTLISQICTLLYFGFFLLMPWYSRIDRTTAEPARVTMRGH